jgi:hypothetical protein
LGFLIIFLLYCIPCFSFLLLLLILLVDHCWYIICC